MNIHTKIKADRPNLHQPAEPARRRFTSAELLAMDEAGVLHPEERVELIDGEIITMPAKSARHDDMCAALVLHFADHRPTDERIAWIGRRRLTRRRRVPLSARIV